ncbi:MAG: hypothetical protein WD118_03795 [Phycisphaeraceae bacterium]
MSIRDTLNNNSAVVTIAAVVILCVALAVIIWNSTGGPSFQPRDIYFVDLNTDEIFVAKSDQYPPIAAPSDTDGQTSGVGVRIYACGECPTDLEGRSVRDLGGEDVWVAYLERWSDEARAMMRNELTPEDTDRFYELPDAGHEVRALDDDRWNLMYSNIGQQLVEGQDTRCGDETYPALCRPE